jgi:hypothetical protein
VFYSHLFEIASFCVQSSVFTWKMKARDKVAVNLLLTRDTAAVLSILFLCIYSSFVFYYFIYLPVLVYTIVCLFYFVLYLFSFVYGPQWDICVSLYIFIMMPFQDCCLVNGLEDFN